jgi:3' terminal RNA ribose 2'-O-methyltransferase Hen1
MLLTITTTARPATDLGFLLHKNPARVQEFELSFGKAHIFYPEAGDERCTAAMLLDIDPVWLVRGRRGGPAGEAGLLEQYVNDRPYVASSFMSVAIARVFGTALGGRSESRPELAETAIPLEAHLSVLPCRGGEELLKRLFEPLGYEVRAMRHPLEPAFADWGESRFYTVDLRAQCRLKDLLTHLYVLIPVLDDEKHYWVGDAEMEKLLRHAGEWLADHPERAQIASRYLRHQPALARLALARLTDAEIFRPDDEEEVERHAAASHEESLTLQ